MPLSFADAGTLQKIKKIGGKDETKHFLESLGFTAGTEVTIISKMQGNMIVNVKESRVAISEAMATRIMI